MADLGSVCYHIDTLETAVLDLVEEVGRIADALDRLTPPAPTEPTTPPVAQDAPREAVANPTPPRRPSAVRPAAPGDFPIDWSRP